MAYSRHINLFVKLSCMEMEKWLFFYGQIAEDLGFSKEMDRQSAVLLDRMVQPPDMRRLKTLLENKSVNIYGAGPSLEKTELTGGGVNVVADGVCTFFLERGVLPDIVVTDLDGRIDDLLAASERGAVVIIHAHGDNIGKLQKYVPRFKNPYGTTQAEPFGNLMNFGGFTDGDRAGFIVEHFKPRRISFRGMDFEDEPGRYSFTTEEDIERKKKKLAWAKRLLDYLENHSETDITFHY